MRSAYPDDVILLDTTITILDVIHRPVFYLKHDVSETEFCLCLQVRTTEIGRIEKAELCLRTTSTICCDTDNEREP
jgi:hypothetical protein